MSLTDPQNVTTEPTVYHPVPARKRGPLSQLTRRSRYLGRHRRTRVARPVEQAD
ncbi:hypothetical protein FB566_0294 [Stackebrandtia endophytica]|uniref:Uncharacterized protein n=1 Tax=Stackebrandtia endophytica TaxID=1496996 RepID=A0A543AQJ0_9ACTN|nr:hypothetical protein [Stackebrandtia endophytica]TQL74806.1 hypothetical protein FB566_0294 [Stackebrandtia endophytica]